MAKVDKKKTEQQRLIDRVKVLDAKIARRNRAIKKLTEDNRLANADLEHAVKALIKDAEFKPFKGKTECAAFPGVVINRSTKENRVLDQKLFKKKFGRKFWENAKIGLTDADNAVGKSNVDLLCEKLTTVSYSVKVLP